jgi:hypothetical protein
LVRLGLLEQKNFASYTLWDRKYLILYSSFIVSYIGLWCVSPLLHTCIWIILKVMNLSLCLHFFIYKRYSARLATASDNLLKKEVIHFLTLSRKHYFYNWMKLTANLTTIILKCLLNNWMGSSLSQYHILTFIFSKPWQWKNGGTIFTPLKSVDTITYLVKHVLKWWDIYEFYSMNNIGNKKLSILLVYLYMTDWT